MFEKRLLIITKGEGMRPRNPRSECEVEVEIHVHLLSIRDPQRAERRPRDPHDGTGEVNVEGHV